MVHDPLFRVGILPVHPFGLFAAAGMVVGYCVGLWRAQRAGLSVRRLPSLFLFIILGGLACARLGYGAQHLSDIHDGSQGLLSLWLGGLSLPAGVIGGVLLLSIVTWARGDTFWGWADALAPGSALGLAIGVLGLPAAGDGWGQPTAGPVFMHVDPSVLPLTLVNNTNFTPIFAYEGAIFATTALFLSLLSWRRGGAAYLPGTVGLAFIGIVLFCYALLQPLTLAASTPTTVLQTQGECALGIAAAVAVYLTRRRYHLKRHRRAATITRVQPVIKP